MVRGFYMYENDRTLEAIHAVGVYLNVGFRLDNLLAMESPIEKPTPIFSSPRNLERFQNVPNGTERHLVKSSGASACTPSDVTIGPHFSGGPIFVPWGCTLYSGDFIGLHAVIVDYVFSNDIPSVQNNVRLAIQDGASRRFSASGLFSVIPAEAGIQGLDPGSSPG